MVCRILIIILLFSHSVIFGTNYYVATDGDDDNPGTLAEPWATWGKAFNSGSWGITPAVNPGDTVFFRGGVYNKNLSTENNWFFYPNYSEGGTGYEISRNGTSGNLIVYCNYSGEVPILDCYDAYHPTYNLCYGIRGSADFVKLKGLTVRNVRQIEGRDMSAYGISLSGDSAIIENCTVYDIWGAGYYIGNGVGENTYIINCDAYNCCDSLSAALPGNDGYGFFCIESAGNVYFRGCRAWLCGDDGFTAGILYEGFQTQYIEYDSCWSFRNGLLQGGGSGFKMGWISYTDGNLKRTYKHCIAAYNRWNGWKTNDYLANTKSIYCNVYNNIAYYNGWMGGVEYVSGGFEIHNVSSDDANENLRIFRNNISYANEGGAVWTKSGGTYTHSNNSWDSDVTVTDADFVSVDSTGLAGARGSDGSLPVLTFLNLASTSDLIDAGTDVGLDYLNDAPDLGYFEYETFPEVSAPYINTNEPIITRSRDVTAGGNMIYAGGGTISSKGVCISQQPDPDIADTVIYAGTGTADFTVRVPNLTKSTTYHVRAYATNETGTAYGADVEFTTPASSPVKTGGKLLKHGNYYIKIE